MINSRHVNITEEELEPLNEVRAKAISNCSELDSVCDSHISSASEMAALDLSNTQRYELLDQMISRGVVRQDVNALIQSHRDEEDLLLQDVIKPLIRRRSETLPIHTRDQAWSDSALSGVNKFISEVDAALNVHQALATDGEKYLKRHSSLENVIRSFESWARGLSD